MWNRWRALALGAAAVLAADAAGGAPPRTARAAAGQEPAGEAAVLETSLSDVRAEVPRWLGREVRFVLQFRALVEGWNPFLSRFGDRDWIAFSGWADERFTWDSEVFEDPANRLFVRRGTRLAEVVSQAEAYGRFEVRARVREMFLGEPWLEVLELRPLPEQVGEGTILHVGRAREFMRDGNWNLALEQFERAKAGPLPAHARVELERHIIECRLARKAQTEAKKRR